MPSGVRQKFEAGLSHCLGQSDAPVTVLVALSGGADSVALLHLLSESAPNGRFSIAACHVHHGIRKEEADGDEQFCRALCQRLSVPFRAVRVDVPAAARQQHRGLEETARELRYRALQEVAEQWSCTFIATAHHADDHLETLLFHLARGSGTAGMLGIAPVRGNLIRPMLACTKEEILSYLQAIGAQYRTDSTNSDTDYTRNYIRHVLLPGMYRINPRAAEAALSMSGILRSEDAYLSSLLPAEMPSLPALAELPFPLLCRLLRREYEKAGGAGAGEGHFRALAELVLRGKTGQSLSLPGSVTAMRQKTRLVFLPTERCRRKRSQGKIYPVLHHLDSIASSDQHIILIESDKKENNGQKVYNLSINTAVNSAILSKDLHWRTRLPGDTIRFGGMTRKIKKLLWQTGLSPDLRDTLPIVCDEKGPLWVPGFPVRDDALPDENGSARLIFLPNEKTASAESLLSACLEANRSIL